MQEIANFAATLHDLSQGMGGLPQLLAGPLDDASNLAIWRELNAILRDALADYGARLFERMMSWVGMAALTLLTLWIMIQGYRIVSGQSRDSMMALVTNSMKAVVIVSVATGMALGGSTLYEFISNDLGNQVNRLVTGDTGDVYESIDRSLGYMQLGFSSIDAIQTGGNQHLQDVNDRNTKLVALGMAGPAIVAGSMLLYYKGMMALIVGFAPLCVLSLLFEQSKGIFQKWLNFLLGTLFSLAVLSVLASLAMDIISAVAASFWTGKLLGSNPEGINSLAMQQGGIGLVLTILLITLPQGAASFFGGLMTGFASYSAFGNLKGGTDSAGRAPGVAGYQPPRQPPSSSDAPQANHSQITKPRIGENKSSADAPPGSRGAANRDRDA